MLEASLIRTYFLYCLFTAILFASASSATEHACANREGPNVILFMVDGVRLHEFFHGTSPVLHSGVPKTDRGVIFKKFWSTYAKQGVVYGGMGLFNRYKIGSKIAVSQPSYNAIFLGKPDSCEHNGCRQVSSETFLERIKRELKLKKTEVAVISSWENIAFSTESVTGTLLVNSGIKDMDDGTKDDIFTNINTDQKECKPPWPNARKDEYTLAMAMHYLDKHCPRVLYISLDDSDEWGHKKNYPEYVKALQQYDVALEKLIVALEKMGKYGKNTTLFFTTDHGRGPGPLWYNHAITPFSEKGVFLYARGPSTKSKGRVFSVKRKNHLYLRPTIESLMGLVPTRYQGKSRLLKEVLPNPLTRNQTWIEDHSDDLNRGWLSEMSSFR